MMDRKARVQLGPCTSGGIQADQNAEFFPLLGRLSHLSDEEKFRPVAVGFDGESASTAVQSDGIDLGCEILRAQSRLCFGSNPGCPLPPCATCTLGCATKAVHPFRSRPSSSGVPAQTVTAQRLAHMAKTPAPSAGRFSSANLPLPSHFSEPANVAQACAGLSDPSPIAHKCRT
jgi:hypothetical protein